MNVPCSVEIFVTSVYLNYSRKLVSIQVSADKSSTKDPFFSIVIYEYGVRRCLYS